MAENGNKPYKAHVLVLPFPAQGHINPMLQFCKRLASKGLKTTFVNTLFISSNTQPSASSLISTATISDGHDGCGFTVAGDPGSYLARFRSVGSDTLSDLIKKLDGQGMRVDGLVYDPFLPWALDVAREFGLVGAAFFTQSCAVSNVYYHVRKGILKLPFEEGKAILVPGLPPLERSETPSFVGDYGSYPAFCDMLVNQFSNIDKADWVLFNTFYDLEEEVRLCHYVA